MGVQNPKQISILLITLLSLAGSFPAVGQGNSGADDLDARISRMTRRVNFGLKQGFIQQEQGEKLQNDLKDIGMQAASARKANGGQLKPTDLTGFESRLNQNSNLIQSYNRAGSRKTAAPNATGPAWVKGDDGAQDPRMLKRRMKAQEQKQLQQEDAAIMQVKEQQQQQYEKEMLEKLGSQRPTILKNKQDLDQIRQNTGAN